MSIDHETSDNKYEEPFIELHVPSSVTWADNFEIIERCSNHNCIHGKLSQERLIRPNDPTIMCICMFPLKFCTGGCMRNAFMKGKSLNEPHHNWHKQWKESN